MEVVVVVDGDMRAMHWKCDLSFRLRQQRNKKKKKWHSTFAGTITHSSQFACSAYQMRLIVIGDDIAPVCRAASVRCTMENFFRFFCFFFLRSFTHNAYMDMDLEDEALWCSSHRRQWEHCCYIVSSANANARASAYIHTQQRKMDEIPLPKHFLILFSAPAIHQSSSSSYSTLGCSCRVALLFMWSNLNAWCDSSVKFYPRMSRARWTDTLQWCWWV